jgi:uncharacterized membrane protein
MKSFQKYVLAGLVTAIPLMVTWVVFSLVLNLLARAGGPVVGWLSGLFETQENVFATWLLHPWTQWVLAVALTILVLFILGFAASRVVGRRLISVGHSVLVRLPFIERIYGGVKHFIDAMQPVPNQPRSAVLIEWPHPAMKVLGFITRTMKDQDTGELLAVVFIPTTPVPSSGFLQIVPMSKVVRTNLTFDDATSFIMTGGTRGPEFIPFSASGIPAASDEPGSAANYTEAAPIRS